MRKKCALNFKKLSETTSCTKKNDYFCVEKYALTDNNEQLFNNIQPFRMLRESSDFCKICHG